MTISLGDMPKDATLCLQGMSTNHSSTPIFDKRLFSFDYILRRRGIGVVRQTVMTVGDTTVWKVVEPNFEHIQRATSTAKTR